MDHGALTRAGAINLKINFFSQLIAKVIRSSAKMSTQNAQDTRATKVALTGNGRSTQHLG